MSSNYLTANRARILVLMPNILCPKKCSTFYPPAIPTIIFNKQHQSNGKNREQTRSERRCRSRYERDRLPSNCEAPASPDVIPRVANFFEHPQTHSIPYRFIYLSSPLSVMFSLTSYVLAIACLLQKTNWRTLAHFCILTGWFRWVLWYTESTFCLRLHLPFAIAPDGSFWGINRIPGRSLRASFWTKTYEVPCAHTVHDFPCRHKIKPGAVCTKDWKNPDDRKKWGGCFFKSRTYAPPPASVPLGRASTNTQYHCTCCDACTAAIRVSSGLCRSFNDNLSTHGGIAG